MKSIFGFFALFLLICSCAEKQPEKSVIDVNELTIAKIHQAYQSNTYNSEDLVNAYLQEIKNTDTLLNAITFINPNAINEAKRLDSLFKATGELRPLHGVPVIVKDNINAIGTPTTAGSLALKDFYPTKDAFIIQKLKNAGAIVLAKSNMAEWAFSPKHTESSTHGTTKNPYNTEYVPAGSSGGTAASVASNMGMVGLGTDTGNSIRGPSSHTALVGFRTTLGLISRDGIVPLFLRNDVVGPMCRSVEDATKVMEAMVGYDSTDIITKHSIGKTEKDYQQYLDKNGMKGARIGVLSALMGENTDPEIRTLFNTALSDIKSLGAEAVEPIVIPNFETLKEDQWCSTFKQDVETFLKDVVKIDTIQTVEDIIEAGTTSMFAKKRLDAYSSKTGRWGKAQTECLDTYTDDRRIAFRAAIRSVMDSLELDAIVYPSWSQRPARIPHFEEEYGGDNNQEISPHTGQPAFTVPMGYLEGNLPSGIQFLGRMYDEATLIKLAYAYEQGTLHRKPPVLK